MATNLSDPVHEDYTTALDQVIAFDFSIFGLVALLVPYTCMIVAAYRNTIRQSKDWKEETKLLQGVATIRTYTMVVTLVAMTLLTSTAILISLMTKNIGDQMLLILQGISRLFGAIFLLTITMITPTWTGVYYRRRDKQTTANVGDSIPVLRFNFIWTFGGQFGLFYFLFFPFFTGGRQPATIPLSIIFGMLVGGGIVTGIYFARTKTERTKNWVSRIMVFIFTIASGVIFGDGCWFIATVWGDDALAGGARIYFIPFFTWLAFAYLIHFYLWWNTRRMREADSKAGNIGESTANPFVIIDDSIQGEEMDENTEKQEEPLEEKDPEDMNLDNFLEDVTKEGMEKGTGAIDFDDINEDIKKDGEEEANPNKSIDDKYETEERNVPTCWSMTRSKFSCCGCIRGSNLTRSEKSFGCCLWTMWTLTVAAALYFSIVNMGAVYQADIVAEKLPAVYEELYRYMDFGEVCAFDNKGAESNITTFADKAAAHDAGFLILHCGACAACSDWHNLRLEYTTREVLAKESAKCARKSLFGRYQDVVDCLSAPEPINFQGKCAECWATDILCTKANCTFIFLQSLFINAVSNFAVDNDTITSATCEEAHCEVGQFVPCSGATRRRMNVTSSITRPGAQRCSIVDVDWAELFPE